MSDAHTLKLTSAMEADEMEAYWTAVIEQLGDYVKLYPAHTTLDMLFAGIAKGKYQLWIVVENDTNECVMSVVTQIVTNDVNQQAAVNVQALAGSDLSVLAPKVHDIIAWAKKRFNITEAEIVGRPGIQKVLGQIGFKMEAVVMKRSV
jgi:hypothetical protein